MLRSSLLIFCLLKSIQIDGFLNALAYASKFREHCIKNGSLSFFCWNELLFDYNKFSLHMPNQERYKMNFIVVLAWKLDELLLRIKEDSHRRNSITTWMFNKSTASPVATSKIYAVDAMLEAHRNREGNKPGFRSGENCMEEGASQDYSQDNQEMGTRGPLENSPHIYHNSNSPRDTGMQEWFPSWLIKCSKRQCAGQSSIRGQR